MRSPKPGTYEVPPPDLSPLEEPSTTVAVVASGAAEEEEELKSTSAPTGTLMLMVVALCVVNFMESAVEVGTGPCVFTTLETELDASTTAVAAAVVMADVCKIVVMLGVGYLGASAHKPVFVAAATIVWMAGCLIIGFAGHIALVGLGSALLGFGYSFFTVLVQPIINDVLTDARDKVRIPLHIGIIISMSALGIAVAFVVCGGTLDHWRYNYYLAPIFLVPGSILMLVAHNSNLPHLVAFNATHLRSDEQGDASRQTTETAAGPKEGGAHFGIALPEEMNGDAEDNAAADNNPPHVDEEVEGEHGANEPETVHDIKTFAAALKGGDIRRPPFFKLMQLHFQNPTAIFTICSQTANFFYVAAFISLLPKFVEEHLEQDKSTASFIMAAVIPAVFLGMVLGGAWCKWRRYTLRHMLAFSLVTNLISVPCVIGVFHINDFGGFVVFTVFSMFVQFLPVSASISLLAPAVTWHHSKFGGALEDGTPVPLPSMVSSINGLSSFLTRLLGSIPGPLVLAVLLDNYKDELTMPGAYSLTAAFGSVIGAAFATVAWMKCPPDDEVAAILAVAPVETLDDIAAAVDASFQDD